MREVCCEEALAEPAFILIYWDCVLSPGTVDFSWRFRSVWTMAMALL